MQLDSKNRNHFFGIFAIALAVLAYQVLLTRLFSVTLYYHFAFAGISLAMLGLTVGAERVYVYEKRFTRERLELEWAKAALGFSVSSVVLVLWFLYAALILPERSVLVILSMSLVTFVIPFIYSGICVTLILTKSAEPIGRLYGADLMGAALGCMGVVCVLFVLDPVSIVFALAALAAFAAWRMARGLHQRLAKISGVMACFWLAASVIQGGLYLTDHDHLRVIWAKSRKQENTLFERWNAFSRIRVIPYDKKTPFGWGFGHVLTENIDQLWLDIDADAATILTHFTGDVKPLSYLADDVINIGYQVRPVGSVAVIGVGGGRNVISALYFGARKVTGIELNPAIIEALTKKFADFTGHITERPDVELINAEARSWLSQSPRRFDLVQISLIDTWAATAAGGLTLTENKLYTREAWKEFLDHLNPNGMLVVSRWFDPKAHKGEFYRLLSLAVGALEEEGVPPAEVRRHILAFNASRIITVAISPAAFTPAEVSRVESAAKARGFTVMMSPDNAWDEISKTIASGKADKAFYDAQTLDVTAPTDDRPFFFYMVRWKDLLTGRQEHEGHISLYNNAAIGIVFFLLVATLLCTLVFILQPLISLAAARKMPVKAMLPHLAYFGGIGLGFMLIEISQMQRLMVFLGHPVYGLSVVLFTLLLFGGLGSTTISPMSREAARLRPLLLLLVLVLTGLVTPMLTEQLKVCGTAIRILTSVALLAPAGFCMGMMFPLGMLMSARERELQAWFWGVNGATSVFASVLGMAISMEFGIADAYWAGVACYVFCAIVALHNTKEIAS